jgi:hypothetical protein
MKGQPRYRLTLYVPASEGVPPPVDYWARLIAYQPKALTKAHARSRSEARDAHEVANRSRAHGRCRGGLTWHSLSHAINCSTGSAP